MRVLLQEDCTAQGSNIDKLKDNDNSLKWLSKQS